MKKQVVATVMMLSLAIVMTGCNNGVSSNTVPTDTQITQVEITDRTSYKDVVELELGDTLTLDKILKVKDENMTYDFVDKTYEAAGTYDEVIKYDNGELKFKVVVSDKTAPVIEGTHDIEVVESSEVNLLDGVSINEGELTVSDYDASLLDEAQVITYTAKDEAGNVSEATISLLIKSNPIEALDKTMYAQSTVNVRSGCSTENEKLGSLSTNDAVHIVGRDKASGWYQIEFNGSLGYVSNNYLGDNQVVISKPSNSGGNSSNSSSGGSNSSGAGQSSTPSSSDSGSSSGGSSSGGSSGVHTITDAEIQAEDDALADRLQNNEMYNEDGSIKIGEDGIHNN